MKKRITIVVLSIVLLTALFLPTMALADTCNYNGSFQYGFFTGSLSQYSDDMVGDHNIYASFNSSGEGSAAGYYSYVCAGQNVNNSIMYEAPDSYRIGICQGVDHERDWYAPVICPADCEPNPCPQRSICLRIQNGFYYGTRIYAKGTFWLDNYIMYS